MLQLYSLVFLLLLLQISLSAVIASILHAILDLVPALLDLDLSHLLFELLLIFLAHFLLKSDSAPLSGSLLVLAVDVLFFSEDYALLGCLFFGVIVGLLGGLLAEDGLLGEEAVLVVDYYCVVEMCVRVIHV